MILGLSKTIKSHSLVYKDFNSLWYRRWARELKQDKNHLDNHALKANKFWQNAVMAQVLYAGGFLKKGRQAIGFGVGQERLPALFAKYNVQVLATDQDFKSKKAEYWSKQELAKGLHSLNKLSICKSDKFNRNIQYQSVDMTRISKSLYGKFDFAWSNCALGHLGSIPAGLKFIEESLQCVKPGGIVVHTTEFNILSNKLTPDSGSTVLFRSKDIYGLLDKLTKAGYICEYPEINLQGTELDQRISMRPEFGNDYSKIQVMGHLATQIVLKITKPQTKPTTNEILESQKRLKAEYEATLDHIEKYKKEDPAIVSILASQLKKVDDININAKHEMIKTSIGKNKTKILMVEFNNQSDMPLFGLYSRLADSKPLLLATANPNDRASVFADSNWVGEHKNRASHEIYVFDAGAYKQADYVLPHQNFAFKVSLNTKAAKKSEYIEDFAVVQENQGWVPNSHVKIQIKIK